MSVCGATGALLLEGARIAASRTPFAEVQAAVQAAGSATPERQSWIESVLHLFECWYDTGDIFTLPTSGSTGTAKQIRLSKRAMQASARRTTEFFGLRRHDLALLCLPVDRIGGAMMCVRALEAGLRLLCMPPSADPLGQILRYNAAIKHNNAPVFPAITIEQPIRFAALTPHQAYSLTSLEHLSADRPVIDQVLLGGAPVSDDLLGQLTALVPQVYEGYGMTETCSHVALRKLEADQRQPFRALAGVCFSADPENRLIICAPHLGIDALLTDDLVELIDESRFHWKGRYSAVINSGGVKIFAEELEARLAGLIPYPFFIGGRADALLGEKVVLVVECVALERTDQAWQKELQKRLHRYQIPKAIFTCPTFARTSTGKIQRSATLAQESLRLFCAEPSC